MAIAPKRNTYSSSSDDSIRNAEERWNRKPKPSFSYFSGRHLKTLTIPEIATLVPKLVSSLDKDNLEFLENGLINIGYYTLLDEPYFIGYYPFMKITGNKTLTSEEFHSLSLTNKTQPKYFCETVRHTYSPSCKSQDS